VIAQADGGEGAEGAEEKGAKAEEAAGAAAGAEEVTRGDTYVRGVEARAAAAAGVLAGVWARGAPRYAPHPEVAECALTCVRLRGAGEAAALHVQATSPPYLPISPLDLRPRCTCNPNPNPNSNPNPRPCSIR